MDQLTFVGIVLLLAAGIGVVATWAIVRRERMAAMEPAESPFAASTEGEKRCPKCGMGNLWTDAFCVSCHAKLPG